MDEVQLAKQVGRMIAARRQAASLTQAQVADRMGLTSDHVSRMERGLIVPTLGRLAQLSDILSVPIAALLEEASPLTVDVTNEVYRALETLSDSDRIWVKNMLTELCTRLAAQK